MITIKSILYSLLNIMGVFLPKKHASILLYHDVSDSDLYLTVSPNRFREQMQFLHNSEYKVISLKMLGEILRNKREVQKNTVVLTFDDGYKSHLSSVLPILEEYNFHGTFFISTNFLGETINNSEGKPQVVMDSNDLKELENSKYADIEPHTLSHKELPTLEKYEKKEEIVMSKKQLEVMLNKTCGMFAYPRGLYDKESIEIVRESGFISAVTVNNGVVQKKSNPLTLPRNTINSGTRLPEFKARLGRISHIISLFRT